MTHKEKLVAAINNDYVPEEVCQIFLQLAQPHLGKGVLMDIVYGKDKGGKVDSAYPSDYAQRVRELLPKFRGEFMVYDYNEPTDDDPKASRWGTFENVAERTIQKINYLMNNRE